MLCSFKRKCQQRVGWQPVSRRPFQQSRGHSLETIYKGSYLREVNSRLSSNSEDRRVNSLAITSHLEWALQSWKDMAIPVGVLFAWLHEAAGSVRCHCLHSTASWHRVIFLSSDLGLLICKVGKMILSSLTRQMWGLSLQDTLCTVIDSQVFPGYCDFSFSSSSFVSSFSPSPFSFHLSPPCFLFLFLRTLRTSDLLVVCDCFDHCL